VPQLPLNNVLSSSGPAPATSERSPVGAHASGKVVRARPSANSAGNTVQEPLGGSSGKAAPRAQQGTNFMQALANELRELDPAAIAAAGLSAPVATAGTVAEGLPAGGKTSPHALPLDPDAPPTEGTPPLVLLPGVIPLPLQPQAATDQLSGLPAGASQNTEPLLAANSGRTASRGLLAMLERQTGPSATNEKSDPAALRAFATTMTVTTSGSMDATALLSAAASAGTPRDAGTTTTTSTPSIADSSPATPNAAAATQATASGEPVRTPVPVAHVEQPVGTNAWKDEVGQQVTWMIQHQVGRAELRLHPAHLGPIEVSVSVNNDEVNVSFQASHPATREALESSLPRLRELLGHSGLSLGQASVSQQFAGDQRTPERAPSSQPGTSSPFEERSVQIDAPVTSRVRMGLLDAYA
jgi:flagellar hook-length control protein FliK